MEPNSATLSSQPSCHLSSGSARRLHLYRPNRTLISHSAWEGRVYVIWRHGTLATGHHFLSRAKSAPPSRASLHFCFLNVQEFPFVHLFRPHLAVDAFSLQGFPGQLSAVIGHVGH